MSEYPGPHTQPPSPDHVRPTGGHGAPRIPQPSRSTRSTTPQTHRRSFTALSVLVLAVVVVGAAYGAWVLHVAQLAAQPIAAANTFCTDLRNKQYTQAYNLLTPSAQGEMSSQVFMLTAQLRDAVDGPIRACHTPHANMGYGFTFDALSTQDTVDMRIVRTQTYSGGIALVKLGARWRVNSLAPSLAGTDIGPLVTAEQFCSAVIAGTYTTAESELAPALRAQVPASALAATFGNSAATTLANCQPSISTYTVAGSDDQAAVHLLLTVKLLASAGPSTVAVPVDMTFARANAWQIASVQLAPAGIAAPLSTAPLTTTVLPSATPAAPAISAAAAILINPATNEVYLASNADQQRAMASTTKIMTTLVAMSLGQLDERLIVGADATALDNGIASVAGLRLGDNISLRNLLYALLLPSGDDAAVVIADGIAGSQPTYVALMNMEAGLLGLRNTHYNDVHGLDTPGHYTTASDLATLTEFAMRFPAFAQVVGTASYTLAPTINHHGYQWENTNLLLSTMPYPGATGVKTGYTGNAGECLVFSATQGTHQLLGVLLGEPTADSRFTDASALLNWGFSVEQQQKG